MEDSSKPKKSRVTKENDENETVDEEGGRKEVKRRSVWGGRSHRGRWQEDGDIKYFCNSLNPDFVGGKGEAFSDFAALR